MFFPITVALAAWGVGCDCGGGAIYEIWIKYADFGQVFVPRWGGASDECIDCDQMLVVLPVGVELREGREMIEFYAEGASAPAPLPGRLVRSTRPIVGLDEERTCDFDALEYALTDLPNGSYTVVHRRSSAPEGLSPTERTLFFARSWMVFDGEEALVTTFRNTVGSPAADAGTASDGGVAADGGP